MACYGSYQFAKSGFEVVSFEVALPVRDTHARSSVFY